MTTDHFIAVAADVSNRGAIMGIGRTSEEAIADAAAGILGSENKGSLSTAALVNDRNFHDRRDDITIDDILVAQPCTRALYEYVEKHGGARLSWRENDEGKQDIEELPAAIVEAADVFAEEFPGEVPDVLYAQLSKSSGWTARFSIKEDSEMSLTRWSTGDDVTELYAALMSKDFNAVVNYAGDIEAGWEDDWTDE